MVGMMESAGKQKKIVIVVENLPCPFDRRVWQEAKTLREAGYQVSIICPMGEGYGETFEIIDDIYIYRHPLWYEANGILGYLLEYSSALFWEFILLWRVYLTRGFDIVHACNPPDLIFLPGGFFKLLGKKFVFDHHDINPELFEAKFGKRGLLYRLALLLERLTFYVADISIATNNSYKGIAIDRGRMKPDRVFVVRSGPNMERLKLMPPKKSLRNGKRFLVGYVGVMGKQEGIDHLLRSVQYITHVLRRQDVQFYLVGGGTELDSLREYANKLKVSDYVFFSGRLSEQELLEVLNTADLCVNPDVANEMNDKSTMNKILEYMALGKPIVQFDLKEGRVSARGASLYAKKNDEVDFALKIIQLLDNEELRIKMGSFGRKRIIDELEWSYEAPKLLEAYSTV